MARAFRRALQGANGAGAAAVAGVLAASAHSRGKYGLTEEICLYISAVVG